MPYHHCFSPCFSVRWVADKSLARPGRKWATVNKLGIYSTYSTRSTIHVFARCCNFESHSKIFRILCFQPGLRGSNDLRFGRKMANFRLFFLVQGTGGRLTGPHPENRMGEQDIGKSGRLVSSGLQVSVEPEHSRARTRPPWRLSRGVFSSKRPSGAPAEMSNTPWW